MSIVTQHCEMGEGGEIFFIQFLSFFSSCLNIYVRRCLKNEKLNEKGLWVKIFEKKLKCLRNGQN